MYLLEVCGEPEQKHPGQGRFFQWPGDLVVLVTGLVTGDYII